MPVNHSRRPVGRLLASTVTATVLTLGLVACSAGENSSGSGTAEGTAAIQVVDLYDTTRVHSISVTFDQTAYDAMIDAYAESEAKEWIEADVTINGTVFKQAGMRLKGNSSLFGLGDDPSAGPDKPAANPGTTAPPGTGSSGSTTTTAPAGGGAPRLPIQPGGGASADEPESLPWLISLDKYVEGQSYGKVTELVVRSSATDTALNEAVALELLAEAGLATQKSTHVRFRVNNREPALRLVIENPNDDWDDANFDAAGILYKAEAGGDWTYRGDDPAAYKNVFDQETRKDDGNLAPLIDFLEFVNNSDDATFAGELSKRLDVEAFADYLAFEELIDNFDDIDGPGNNAYLRYDETTRRFTIVAWDHNLAFGAMQRMGGGGIPGGGAPPTGPGGERPQPPAGGPPAGGPPAGFPEGLPGGGGIPAFGNNVLVKRFQANEEFKVLVANAKTELAESLFANGTAAAVLERRADLLRNQAADLVDAGTIDTEAGVVRGQFAAR